MKPNPRRQIEKLEKLIRNAETRQKSSDIKPSERIQETSRNIHWQAVKTSKQPVRSHGSTIDLDDADDDQLAEQAYNTARIRATEAADAWIPIEKESNTEKAAAGGTDVKESGIMERQFDIRAPIVTTALSRSPSTLRKLVQKMLPNVNMNTNQKAVDKNKQDFSKPIVKGGISKLNFPRNDTVKLTQAQLIESRKKAAARLKEKRKEYISQIED